MKSDAVVDVLRRARWRSPSVGWIIYGDLTQTVANCVQIVRRVDLVHSSGKYFSKEIRRTLGGSSDIAFALYFAALDCRQVTIQITRLRQPVWLRLRESRCHRRPIEIFGGSLSLRGFGVMTKLFVDDALNE